MIDQTRIEKIIKRLLRSSSVEEREAIKPSREWAFGILLTLIAVGVGGVVSYLSYLNSVSVEAVAPAVVEPAAYSGVAAEEAVIRFRERAVRFAELRGDTSASAPIEISATTTVSEVVPSEELPEVPVEDALVEEIPVSESTDLTPQLSF